MHIAHFGTFDVENYGDLLFPVVAKHYLSPLASRFTFVSPKGGPPVCADAETTVGALDIDWRSFDFQGALIGGGNIITTRPTSLPAYNRRPGLGIIAYPALWIAACARAGACGARIAWNAPGLMQTSWSDTQTATLRACVQGSDYVAFREADTAGALLKGNADVAYLPDPAVTLARIWRRSEELLPHAKDNASRWGLDAPYFVVHVKKRNVPTTVAKRDLVASIAQFAKATGLRPLLLPIGRVHGDHDTLKELSDALIVDHAFVDAVVGLQATTAMIANARYVFTASLHCAIVACSYQVPVNLVGVSELPKYRAFFGGHLNSKTTVIDSPATLSVTTFEQAKDQVFALEHPLEVACEAVEQHYRDIIVAYCRRADGGKNNVNLCREIVAANEQVASLGTVLPLGALL